MRSLRSFVRSYIVTETVDGWMQSVTERTNERSAVLIHPTADSTLLLLLLLLVVALLLLLLLLLLFHIAAAASALGRQRCCCCCSGLSEKRSER